MAERIIRRTDDLSGRSFLYLASRSERRRILLAQIGIPHEALAIEVDEGWDGREAPCRYVCRLALAKAQAGGSLLGVPVPLCETALLMPRIGNGREPVDHV